MSCGYATSMELPLLEVVRPPKFNPIYRPLDPITKEIRLIKVLPANDERDPIYIATTHVCLTKNPYFIALSYTWGAESPTYGIEVYDPDDALGRLSVRQNLHEFLTAMRSPAYHGTWFWIDQICINQDDEVERSQQVSQMAELYTRATFTIIWLGPSFHGSDEFMEFIAQANIDFEGLVKEMGSSPMKLSDPAKHIWEIYNAACHRFITMSYWSRIWIIQEIALSARPIVHLGSKFVQWPLVKKCLHFFRSASHASKTKHPILRYDISSMRFVQCDIILSLDRPGNNVILMANEHTWQSIINVVTFNQCTDLRDKAYGTLGLLSERFRIYPDYSKTSTPSTIILEIVRKEVENILYDLKMLIAAESDPVEASNLVRNHLAYALLVAHTMIRWNKLFHEEDATSYDGAAMRSCLRREVLDKFREQRAALGGRGGHHKFLDKIISRVLFPNKWNYLVDYFYRFFWICNDNCVDLDYIKDMHKERKDLRQV
jgi:hypothetical protein